MTTATQPRTARVLYPAPDRPSVPSSYGHIALTLLFGVCSAMVFQIGGALLFFRAQSSQALLAGAALIILGLGIALVAIFTTTAQVAREALQQRVQSLRSIREVDESVRAENAALGFAVMALTTLVTIVGVDTALERIRQLARTKNRGEPTPQQQEALRESLSEGRSLDAETFHSIMTAAVAMSDSNSGSSSR